MRHEVCSRDVSHCTRSATSATERHLKMSPRRRPRRQRALLARQARRPALRLLHPLQLLGLRRPDPRARDAQRRRPDQEVGRHRDQLRLLGRGQCRRPAGVQEPGRAEVLPCLGDQADIPSHMSVPDDADELSVPIMSMSDGVLHSSRPSHRRGNAFAGVNVEEDGPSRPPETKISSDVHREPENTPSHPLTHSKAVHAAD